MSETKHAHTPGPWRIIAEHGDDRDVFARQELLATAYDMNGSQPKAVAEANARLIAAAPELLDACELAEQSLSGIPLSQTDMMVLMNRIRGAISKAKGVIPVHSHEENEA